MLSHLFFIFVKLATNAILNKENYIILQEYIKCVLLLLTEVMSPTMNLISGTHDFCEKRKYAFNILPEYSIITLLNNVIQYNLMLTV